MSKKLGTAIAVVAAFGIMSFANADGDAKAKADDKGKVEVKEVGRFGEMDVNKDGSITADEFSVFWGGRANDVDTDKDGKISADERKAAANKHFTNKDANKDGFLTKEEFTGIKDAPECKDASDDAKHPASTPRTPTRTAR